MLTELARYLLFGTSFSPALFLLGVRFVDRDVGICLVLLAGSLLLAALAWPALRLLQQGPIFDDTIVTVEPLRESLTSYAMGYLLPFVLVDLDDRLAVTAAAIFVTIVAVMYVRANLVYLNPLLALAGYRLWQVTVRQTPGPERAIPQLLLTRMGHVAVGDRIQTRAGDAHVRVTV
jgi:hypothetical protein